MTLRAKLKRKNKKIESEKKTKQRPTPVVIQANISETQTERILWNFHSRYLVVIRLV